MSASDDAKLPRNLSRRDLLGVFWGGVKDLCYTRGVRSMGGTMVLSDLVPSFDATAVARLRDAGAVVLRKLTLCEGAMDSYHLDLVVATLPTASNLSW